jgi:signal transduction histidine kinase
MLEMNKGPFVSAYRLQVFFICALLHGLSYLEFHRLHPIAARVVYWREQFHILLILSLLISLGIGLHRRQLYAFVGLITQFFFILIMNYPERGNVSLTVLLFSIPLVEAMLVFKKMVWPALFTPILAILSATVHPVPFWNEPEADPSYGDLAFLGLSMITVTLIVLRLWHVSQQNENQRENLRRQSLTIDNLLNANLDFQTYAAEIGEKSTIEERKRLTREVHDIVGYTLINIRMMLEAGIELTPPNQDRLKELLHQARDQVMSGLLEARRALRNFRAIDSNLLEGTNRLQRFIRSFSQATGIQVEVNFGNIPPSFGPEIDRTLVRIVQEAMTNAFRHGKATEIQIGFWVDQGLLLVKISDNGIGALDIKPGIGLTGMGERVEALHGTLTTRSSERGFTVSATIPIRRGENGKQA